MTKIGFVILTWNSENCIYDCLSSVFSLDSSKLCGKIIVIDNGSSDRSLEQISRVISDYNRKSKFICDVHKLDRNCGTTISRNIGLRSLINDDVDYICILDSDTIVNTNAILTLTRILDNDSTIGIIGPRMKDKHSVYQHSGRNLPTLTEKLCKVMPVNTLREKGIRLEVSIPNQGHGCVPVGYLMSACWVMRKELLLEIGLLDEKIFYAPEDVDYCICCQKAGYSVQYCYDVEIIHEWQRLSRKKLFSKHNFEHIKGLVYMFFKHKYLFNTEKIEKIYKKNRKSVKR